MPEPEPQKSLPEPEPEPAEDGLPVQVCSEADTAALRNWAEYIAADPQLCDVQTPAQLHARLAMLSAALDASDGPDSAFKQLTFPRSAAAGAHPCPVFEPNRFKKAFSTEGVRMISHYRYAVKEEGHCLAALEEGCTNEPSLVLAADPSASIKPTGAVYQGGFLCVGNLAWLQRHNVVAVVNTAKDLGAFFRKFPAMVAKASAAGIEFFECGWVDAGSQELAWATVEGALRFIEQARQRGGGVLIHCAQASVCLGLYTIRM